MNANELMIGDWVHYRGTNIRVTSLYDKGGSNEIGWGDKESTWVNGRTVEPIPLTPEILERNGFERSRVFVEWKYVNDDIYILWKPFPWIKILNDNVQVLFPCEYVHELQHALRLCGVEKDIKLEE